MTSPLGKTLESVVGQPELELRGVLERKETESKQVQLRGICSSPSFAPGARLFGLCCAICGRSLHLGFRNLSRLASQKGVILDVARHEKIILRCLS